MKISVAMATYNGSRFLREQLDSLAKQTLLPSELVVGDDRSSDDTLAVLEEFARRAPFPVRVQCNDSRLGSSENFLHTARRCTCDWIAFCDQDDVWLPEKLARVSQVLTCDSEVLLCAHRATFIDENNEIRGEFNEPPVRRVTFFPPRSHRLWRTPYGFSEVFRSLLVRDFPFESRPHSSHDRWIFWLANALGSTVFIPDRLARYRRHENNATQLVSAPKIVEQLSRGVQSRQYEQAADSVDTLVSYLGSLDCNEHRMGNRVRAAITSYSRLARNLGCRARVWNRQSSWMSRTGSLLRLMARRGYGSPRSGGFGWRSAAKDVVQLFWPKEESPSHQCEVQQ